MRILQLILGMLLPPTLFIFALEISPNFWTFAGTSSLVPLILGIVLLKKKKGGFFGIGLIIALAAETLYFLYLLIGPNE